MTGATCFWDRVDQSAGPDECWPWTGACQPNGYGRVKYDGRAWLCHRLAVTLAVGPIPPGLNVLHDCDQPPCCNPRHLRVGTQSQNMRDAVSRRRVRVPTGQRFQPGWGKLDAADLDAIVALHRSGLTYRAIGALYDVDFGYVGRVIRSRRQTT